jgi:hypothetical protein
VLSASFVGFLLSISGFYLWVLFSLDPPAKVDDFDELHHFLPKRSKLSPGRRILCLGLLATISMANSIPNIDLFQDKALKHDLFQDKALKHDLRRHCGSHGFLMTANLRTDAIERLRVVVEASKVHLLHDEDYFEVIMDPGCSKICTGHASDFVKGSLVDLDIPITMDGIAHNSRVTELAGCSQLVCCALLFIVDSLHAIPVDHPPISDDGAHRNPPVSNNGRPRTTLEGPQAYSYHVGDDLDNKSQDKRR